MLEEIPFANTTVIGDDCTSFDIPSANSDL